MGLAEVLDRHQTVAVGLEYVEEVRTIAGTLNGYRCTLCNCVFSDITARNMHAKGRRHRLNYKVSEYLNCCLLLASRILQLLLLNSNAKWILLEIFCNKMLDPL